MPKSQPIKIKPDIINWETIGSNKSSQTDNLYKQIKTKRYWSQEILTWGWKVSIRKVNIKASIKVTKAQVIKTQRVIKQKNIV